MRPFSQSAAGRAEGRDASVLKRLRRRFVAIIMALVGVVVLAVAGIGAYNTQASLNALVDQSLERALEARAELPGGENDAQGFGMEHLPVLWVDVTEDGLELASNESRLSVDTSHLEKAVTSALASTESEGRIDEYHLTWRKAETFFGSRVAVADTTSIDAERLRQVLMSAALALGGMAVLFVVAILLSRWALVPVRLAWDQQHQFVADASHELKTPLSVILANTEILRAGEDELPEESVRWVESTAEEAARMKGLVEALLELARTEESAGSARRNVDVDLSAVVEGEALQFDAVAFERGCTISAEVEDDLHVMGDPEQLGRLVKTLIDNACKYAEEGTDIEVSLARQGATAELTVKNYGEPIAAEDLPHVFDRFYRSDKARARETGGFGLGLAIARGIAESHGGKISLTSTKAEGTRFVVTLPVAARQ